MLTNRNEAIISLVTFVDSIIEQWQESVATIDPEYGYQNEINEEIANNVKDEFRSLLNNVLKEGDANA